MNLTIYNDILVGSSGQTIIGLSITRKGLDNISVYSTTSLRDSHTCIERHVAANDILSSVFKRLALTCKYKKRLPYEACHQRHILEPTFDTSDVMMSNGVFHVQL